MVSSDGISGSRPAFSVAVYPLYKSKDMFARPGWEDLRLVLIWKMTTRAKKRIVTEDWKDKSTRAFQSPWGYGSWVGSFNSSDYTIVKLMDFGVLSLPIGRQGWHRYYILDVHAW